MAVQFRNSLLFNKKIKAGPEVLSRARLNVLSDEDITLDPLFNHYQFGTYFTTHDYLMALKQWLNGQNINVTVVLTVRNQADLIPSCYLQKVRFLETPKGVLGFQDYLQAKKEASNGFNLLENFSAYQKAKKVEEILNVPVRILFFEDLKYDQQTYSIELAKLLEVEKNRVQQGLEQQKRKRSAQKNEFEVKYLQLTNAGRLINKFLKGNNLKSKLNRRWGYHFNLLKRWEKKFFMTSDVVQLSKPSEADKAFLKEYFKPDNQALAKNYQLNADKMKSYGYF
jgi:hypothetical protein